MEKKILKSVTLLLLFMAISCSKAEPANESIVAPVPSNCTDSLTLVRLYNALDGNYWKANGKEVGWELARPISEWYGVTLEEINGEMRVVTLFLNGLGLDGEIPSEIGLLTELRTLDLKYNSIKGEIPATIGELSKLELLHLDDNKFTGELPLTLAKLSKLRELRAQKNRLKQFPVEICSINTLTYINLEKNEISTVPGEVVSMSNLEYLYLSDNKITSLPAGLDKMPKLIYLHANKNLIEKFPDEIGALTNLLSLNLSDNRINGEIPASLVHLTGLIHFNVSNNQLTGALPDGMEKMAALETIEAKNNALSGTLPDFGLNPTIQKIQLDGNNFTGDITNYFAGCSELEWLMVADSQLTGTIPLSLASVGKTPQLTYLNLSNNNLTGGVPEGFYDQLYKWNPSFNKLGFHLNGNKLGGAIPEKLLTLRNFKYETNLYPQQAGYGFTNIK